MCEYVFGTEIEELIVKSFQQSKKHYFIHVNLGAP